MSLLRRIALGSVMSLSTGAALFVVLGPAQAVTGAVSTDECATTSVTPPPGSASAVTPNTPPPSRSSSAPGGTVGDVPLPSSSSPVNLCPGAITGRVLDHGRPVAGVAVIADGPGVDRGGTTDATGRYRVGYLVPGVYVLRLTLPSGFEEFHPGVLDRAAAQPVTVGPWQEAAAGTTTVVPHGSLGGRLTTSSGAPASYAYVRVYDVDMQFYSEAMADDDGRYLFGYLLPDRYWVVFWYDDGVGQEQYARRRVTQAAAWRYPVVIGQRTIVNDQLLPAGRLVVSYHLADGTPVTGVQIVVHLSDGAEMWSYTDAEGYAERQLYASQYIVEFRLPDGTSQYWRDATSEADATPIRITGGGTTTLVVGPVGTP